MFSRLVLIIAYLLSALPSGSAIECLCHQRRGERSAAASGCCAQAGAKTCQCGTERFVWEGETDSPDGRKSSTCCGNGMRSCCGGRADSDVAENTTSEDAPGVQRRETANAALVCPCGCQSDPLWISGFAPHDVSPTNTVCHFSPLRSTLRHASQLYHSPTEDVAAPPPKSRMC